MTEDSTDQRLDDLLHAAAWPQPSAQRLAEIRRSFRQREFWRRVVHRIAWSTAAAAALPIVASIAWRQQRAEVRQVATIGPQSQLVIQSASSEVSSMSASMGHLPTARERLLLIQASTAPPPRMNGVAANLIETNPTLREIHTAKDTQRDALLRAALTTSPSNHLSTFLDCVRDPELRKTALAALHSIPDPPVERLIAEFQNPLTERRLAAARAVGVVCDASVVDRLLALSKEPQSQREACAALVCCHDDKARDFIAEAKSQRQPIAAQCQAMQIQMSRFF